MESMTIEQCRAFLLSRGFTHVHTMAGPMPIGDWLNHTGPHGPDWSKARWRWDAETGTLRDALPHEPPFVTMVWRPVAITTRYLLEGIDENGVWDWSHVSADGVRGHCVLDTRAEADAARAELVRIYSCDDAEIRITEVES